MSRKLQPPLPSLSLVKVELPAVIKNEPPESEIGMDDILDSSEEEIIPDVKDIDIVYHPICEESIKSEILESNHCESVDTQISVKAENSPFIKTENITQRNKTENTSNENVTKGTGQAVVEVQGSYEHSNILSNLDTHNGIVTRIRKAKHLEKTNFAKCDITIETSSWKKDKVKIKVIKAPVIRVEPHEYTSLAKDKHVCNHCQRACNKLNDLKRHISRMHREATTMYHCPYCLYKSKWKQYIIREHIIQQHKDTKDIQWFQCNLCEMKFKLKNKLTQHMKVHLRHKQIKDGLDQREKRHHCDKCDFKTYKSTHLKGHKLTHLKPEEIQYFYCYHCSYKAKRKGNIRDHILRHFKNGQVKFDCYICNFMTPKREAFIKHIKKHSKVQDKSEINEGS